MYGVWVCPLMFHKTLMRSHQKTKQKKLSGRLEHAIVLRQIHEEQVFLLYHWKMRFNIFEIPTALRYCDLMMILHELSIRRSIFFKCYCHRINVAFVLIKNQSKSLCNVKFEARWSLFYVSANTVAGDSHTNCVNWNGPCLAMFKAVSSASTTIGLEKCIKGIKLSKTK